MTTHTPAECWHPENWDAVTLAWLHSPEGAADLALVKAAPYLLEACKRNVTALKVLRRMLQTAGLNHGVQVAHQLLDENESLIAKPPSQPTACKGAAGDTR